VGILGAVSDLGSPDITDLILDEHTEFRGQFVALWDLRPSGEADNIAAAWQPLADLLEVHASAEEDILYPVLLKRGGDEAPEETDDAIRDHNKIRDAIQAAAELKVGSDGWWKAVWEARTENSEHLAEEEDEVLPDFRKHAGMDLRVSLGAQWLTFYGEHPSGKGLTFHDKDPQQYIKENS
jgi:hypothetical protein